MAGQVGFGPSGGPGAATPSKKKKAAVPAFQGTPAVNSALAETNNTPEAIALAADPRFQAGPPAAQLTTLGNQLISTTNNATNALQDDLVRRQAAPNAFAGQMDLSGQFGGPAGASAPNLFTGAQPRSTTSQGLEGAFALNAATGLNSLTGPRAAGTGYTGPAVPGAPAPAPSKAETAGEQARDALGPAPTIDMGLADRGKGTVDQALGLSQQVVNSALQPVDQTSLNAANADARGVLNSALQPANQQSLNQATADARNVLDKLLNGPSTADRIGAQTLKSQLALARSAAGGPGAVQEALRNAQNQAPELQAQATQSAVQEQLQRTQAAGAITGQLQGSAIGQQQNETARLGTAANVTGQLGSNAVNEQANQTSRIGTAANAASGFAQGALGSKAQDIQVAQANQSAASNLLNNVAQLTGQQLELDQRNQELIGQMARDAESTKFNWAQLDAQTQEAEFGRWVQVYGIDKAAAAQIAAAAKAAEKSVWDYIVPIIGAGATIGASAVAGPAAPAVAAAAGIPSIAGGR